VTQQLLVPLRGSDRIEEMLPFVQGIAQPGTTVVFLVHFGINRFSELAAQLLTINSGLPANFDADPGFPTGGSDRVSHAERAIQRAADKLHCRGVATKVTFYTGSLRRVLRQCMEDEPVKWVIIRPFRSRILRWCCVIGLAVGVYRPSAPAPVLLLDPNRVARR
jgi:hypothetical protein